MTTHYETTFSGLVPVKYVGPNPDGRGGYIVRVTRTHGPYKKGEELPIMARNFVVKAGYRNYRQYVRTVTPDETPSR